MLVTYAVLQTGGKQYRVKEGDILSIEKIVKTPGEVITFDTVLAIEDGASVKIGQPVLAGATVSAQVLEQFRDDKVIIFKKKRRHNYRRKRGHRQELTRVKIFDISASGAAKKSAPEYKARVKRPVEGVKTGAKAVKKAAAAAKAAPKKAAAKKKSAE
jgi:large subunit ribosomal protein L21